NFARVDRARELAAQKGVSVPQIGIAYILNQKFPVYPIVGAASERELDETLEAAAIALSADELTFLENR
ncbi:MAG: aldo/keto reductase, partial [Defluviitaleaceae bacterium]|nr:aldo/keto reductase [Defluviitaleaceae bacterium]